MQRIIEVYKRHKLPGVSTAYVYRTHIFPEFHISIATLYIYLATPISRELKQMASAGSATGTTGTWTGSTASTASTGSATDTAKRQLQLF